MASFDKSTGTHPVKTEIFMGFDAEEAHRDFDEWLGWQNEDVTIHQLTTTKDDLEVGLVVLYSE